MKHFGLFRAQGLESRKPFRQRRKPSSEKCIDPSFRVLHMLILPLQKVPFAAPHSQKPRGIVIESSLAPNVVMLLIESALVAQLRRALVSITHNVRPPLW